MKLSERVEGITPSGSIKISEKITQLRANGKKIIGLNVGEPDFSSHPSVLEGTKKALDEGLTKYSLVAGENVLREEIINYYNERFNTNFKASNVLVGNGSKQIIYNAFQALLNEGDEVIIPVPYWVTIPESVKLAGGKNVFVPVKQNFHLDIDAIKKAVTSKTKLIYINTPNNPSGISYTREEMNQIESILKEHDLYLLSDEAYEALIYEDEFVSPSSLSEELADRTVCVQSFSKSFCMTGFRLGYMIAPESFIKKVGSFQGHLCGNVPPFTQYGAVAALKARNQIIPPLIKTMKERRDLSISLFKDLFEFTHPSGAFYLFFNIDPYIKKGLVKNSTEMVELLIDKAGVALVPGLFFGMDNYIRLAYTAHSDEIKEAYHRIKEVLK